MKVYCVQVRGRQSEIVVYADEYPDYSGGVQVNSNSKAPWLPHSSETIS